MRKRVAEEKRIKDEVSINIKSHSNSSIERATVRDVRSTTNKYSTFDECAKGKMESEKRKKGQKMQRDKKKLYIYIYTTSHSTQMKKNKKIK